MCVIFQVCPRLCIAPSCSLIESSSLPAELSPSKLCRCRAALTKKKLYESANRERKTLLGIQSHLMTLNTSVQWLVAYLCTSYNLGHGNQDYDSQRLLNPCAPVFAPTDQSISDEQNDDDDNNDEPGGEVSQRF